MIKESITALEQFLHTDVRYLIGGSFWLTVGRGSGALIAFLLSILYARYLPKELYGDYRYVLSVLGALGIFALPGMARVITRGVARGFEGTFLRGARFIFFASFVITAAGAGVAGWFFTHGNTALGWGLLIGALLTPFAEGLGNWRAYFDGMRRFREKTFWNICASVFQGLFMAGIIVAIWYFSLSPVWSIALFVGIFYLSHAIPNILWHTLTRRSIKRNALSEPGAIRYGFHLTMLEAPATLSYFIDSILLHAFLGPSALAVYAFAIAPPEQIKAFLGTTVSAAFPKLAARFKERDSFQELRATLPGKIFRVTLFSAGIVAAYIVAAPFFFKIFFPAYTDSVLFSQVFALSLVLFPFGFFHIAIQTEGNLRKVYWDQLSWPFIQIALLFILIPLFGIWGAVIGKIIGRAFNHGISYLIFSHR